MKPFLKHFLIWFVLFLVLYFVYIKSMASSLGIPDREIQAADVMEGAILSGLVALVFSAVTFLIKKIIKK